MVVLQIQGARILIGLRLLSPKVHRCHTANEHLFTLLLGHSIGIVIISLPLVLFLT